MKRGGWILVQVLIMAVLLGFIASQILKLILQPAITASNAGTAVSNDSQARSAINKVSAAWASAGATCASNATLGVACFGTAGRCSCTCGVDGLPNVAASGPASGPCTLAVTTASP